MGQIIQFIVTIIHDPELVVLDEPFSGLDPVNTELLKRIEVTTDVNPIKLDRIRPLIVYSDVLS